jgi:hypothetical protein
MIFSYISMEILFIQPSLSKSTYEITKYMSSSASRTHTHMTPRGIIGRKKRDGNYSPPKHKLVQDSEGKEENRYSFPDKNKTRIDYPKNLMKPTRTP